MTTCPGRDALERFLGMSDVRQAGSGLAVHIDACPACQATVRRILVGGTADEDTPPAAPPGFELVAPLGRGGMGEVWLARQDRPSRQVAIKFARVGSDPNARARFLVEPDTLARLRHPGVVQILEAGVTPAGVPYFAMEHVPGGSLRGALDGTPWEPVRAVELVRRVARAVGHAHANGVVHRDLKPANILLGGAERHEPKVADFGLARVADAAAGGHTHTGQVLGTPEYMSPEQASGESGVGPGADVYALGVLLYELLAGRPPFRGASPVGTLDLTRSAMPVPLRRLVPAVPRDLETVVLKCLEKRPAARYPSADAVADELDRFLSGRPVVARPLGPLARGWRLCRRHPIETSLAAAVVAALVAGTVVSNAYRVRAEANASAAGTSAAQAATEATRARVEAARAIANREKALDALVRMVELAKRSARQLPAGTSEVAAAFASQTRDTERFIDDTARLFSELVRVNDDDPQVRLENARAHSALRKIHHLRQDVPAARASAARALAELERLHEEVPADRRVTAALAAEVVAATDLDHPWGRADQRPVAEARYQRAGDLWGGLVAAAPTDPNLLAGFAEAKYHLAEFHETGLPPDRRQRVAAAQAAAGGWAGGAVLASTSYPHALRAYEEAVAIQARLVQLAPERAGVRVALAVMHNSRADFFFRHGWGVNPVDHWEQAVATLTPLLNTPDMDDVAAREFEFAAHNLCQNYSAEGSRLHNPARARELYRARAAVNEQFATRNFPAPAPAAAACEAHASLARQLLPLDPKAAAAHADRAAQWHLRWALAAGRPGPDATALLTMYLLRAEGLTRAGDARAAVASWDLAWAYGGSADSDPQFPFRPLYQAGELLRVMRLIPAPVAGPARAEQACRRYVEVAGRTDPSRLNPKDATHVSEVLASIEKTFAIAFRHEDRARTVEQQVRFVNPKADPSAVARLRLIWMASLLAASKHTTAFEVARETVTTVRLSDADKATVAEYASWVSGNAQVAESVREESAALSFELLRTLTDSPVLTAALLQRVAQLPNYARVRALPGYLDWKHTADARVARAAGGK